MDQQRPFLYLSLFFLGFLIWSTWQQEHAPKPENPISNAQVASAQSAGNNNIPAGASIPAINSGDVNSIPVINNTEINESKFIRVRTDVLDLQINLQGGTIVQADLPTYPISLEEQDKPIRILDTQKAYAAQSGLRHQDVNGQYRSDLAPNHYAKFTANKKDFILKESENELVVPLTWNNEKGIEVVKSFTFKRGKFVATQIQTIKNQSKDSWVGSQYLQLTHGEHTRAGSMLAGDIAYTGTAYYNEKYIKVSFGDIEDENLNDQVKGGWAAMLEHYFVSAWIPSIDNQNTYYSIFDKNKTTYIIGVKTPELVVNSGTETSFNSQFYVGPTNQAELASISKGLDLTVDYGIFAFVSKPIFAVMNFIHSYVGNWGWTIIFLTLFIKIIFFYPSAISYRSMAKMKKMSPKIKEINEKYKSDPQLKQKEIMAFYRKEKINPLGGCLPMLIQMPVFMGLYWVLQESVELRQAPWLLWYKDLSLKDPTFILPIIMGASMFIQQKLNPTAVQDPMQQKIFTYLPVVFTVMFLFFPAGLVLYWVVNNILSIIQQYVINKKIIGDTNS